MMVRFTDRQLRIVRFCAIECELQMSGERSVSWMVSAYEYALGRYPRRITEDDVLTLGILVEPGKNTKGYRQCGVSIGWDVKHDWSIIPRQMTKLIEAQDILDAGQWFKEYEEVHPFVDGNGRTGQILFNWLNETLDEPVWAPNFWNDSRRKADDGS